MSFIQHCFIRKNTPELCQILKMLGYRQNFFDDNSGEWLAANHNMFISVNEGFQNLPLDDIDCGDNEELFIALASLRDDTDKNQYCIDTEGNWFLYNKTYTKLLSKTNVNWHKATVEEIIGHFK